MTQIINLSDKTFEEIASIKGTVFSVNWDALIPKISEFVRLRDDEEIQTLTVDEVSIEVKVVRRKGKKVNKSKNALKLAM